jgi:hypothetical protein
LRIATQLGYSPSAPGSAMVSAEQYASDAEQSTLPHELGHQFDGTRWGDAFGRVPAWYDEATAMWMESPSSRQHRLQQAQDGRATAPPLSSVFQFDRPKVDPIGATFSRSEYIGPCRGDCGRSWKTRFVTWRVGSDGMLTSDTLYDDAVKTSVTHADSVARYYQYSIAALYYVRARGGLAALHALAARIGPDSSDTDPLADIVGIPPAGAQREADWRNWLRSAGAVDP